MLKVWFDNVCMEFDGGSEQFMLDNIKSAKDSSLPLRFPSGGNFATMVWASTDEEVLFGANIGDVTDAVNGSVDVDISLLSPKHFSTK